MSRLLMPLLYAAVVLCMGVSCKKEESDPNDADIACYDGSCCEPGLGRYRLIRKLEGAVAELSISKANSVLYFKERVYDNIRDSVGSNIIPICPTTEKLVKGLSDYKSTFPPSFYSYKVWGEVYEGVETSVFIGINFKFHLTKIQPIQ